MGDYSDPSDTTTNTLHRAVEGWGWGTIVTPLIPLPTRYTGQWRGGDGGNSNPSDTTTNMLHRAVEGWGWG